MASKLTYEELERKVLELETKVVKSASTEQALRQSEKKYRTLLENLPQKIFHKDRNSVYVSCNENYATDLNIRPDEIVGKTDYDFFPLHLAEKYRLDDKRIMELETTEDIDESYIENGQKMIVHTVKTPIKDEKGTVVGILGIFWDITEWKRAEKELHKRTHELAERVKELNCLFSISHLVEKPDISLNEILQSIVNLIPSCLQYSEITCSRIILESEEYRTRNFKESTWKQTCEIQVNGEVRGILDVYYLEEKAESDEGPFMKEERNLIQAIAERVGRIIERMWTEKALRETEENFRALAENANDGIVIVRGNGVCVCANEKAAEITGYSIPELVQLNMKTLAHPDKLEELTNRMEGGSTHRMCETTVVGKDGKIVPIEITSATTEWEEQPAAIVIFRDISERKLAEEALRMSEEKFRIIAEQSPNMIFINRSGRIVYANKLCEKTMGYKRSEFYSSEFDYLSLIAPESLKLVQSFYSRHAEGKDSPPYECTLINKQGKRIEVIISARPVEYEGERAILGIVTDISERKRMEERLRLSQMQLEATIESLPFDFFLLDRESHFVKQNSICRKHWGDVTGKRPQDVALGVDLFGDKIARAFSGEVVGGMVDYKLGEKKRYYHQVIAPVSDGIQILGVLGANIDVTDRVLAEQALRQAHDQLEGRVLERTASLREREKELEIKTNNLEELNAALTVLLRKRDEDRKEFEEKVLFNMKQLVVPYLEKLRRSGLDHRQSSYAKILESNLNDIVSPLSRRLSLGDFKFTPAEMHVANLVKHGKATKEIAELLNLSPETISAHRKRIRKKIGIRNQKTNLRAYLLSLANNG